MSTVRVGSSPWLGAGRASLLKSHILQGSCAVSSPAGAPTSVTCTDTTSEALWGNPEQFKHT